MTELKRLTKAQLQHLLGARGERDVAGGRLLALADDLDDLLADRGEIDVETLQGLGGDALSLIEQAEEDVLRAYVVVVEETCFFLGQNNDPTSTIREPLKQSRLLRLAYASLTPGGS